MKKRISSLMLCLTFLLAMSLFAFAADEQATAPDEQISASVHSDGAEVTVEVDLDEKTDIVYGKVTVEYNSDVYELEKAEEGEVLYDIYDLNLETDGVVSAAWAGLTPDEDGGSVVTIILAAYDEEAIYTDAGAIVVTVNELAGEDVTFVTEDDSFEIGLTAEEEGAGPSEGGEETDKSELEGVYELGEDLNEEDYTSDSWEEYVKASENAKAVLNDENATQEEIDSALEALAEAMAALEPVQDAETGIPAAGDNSDADVTGEGSEDGTPDGTSAQTGDNMPLMAMAVLMVIAAAGIIGLGVTRKRRNA